jgi:hypothetical protein
MVRMQRYGSAAVAILALVASTPAKASPWLELRAGPALTSGYFGYEAPYRTEDGAEAVIREHDWPIGVGLDLDGVVGWSLGSELGVGLLGHAELSHYAKQIEVSYNTGRDHAVLGIGPTLALRPGRSVTVGASLEYTHAAIAMSWIAIGAGDNVYEAEGVSGVGGSLSLGCCAEPGFGFGMTARAAWLTGKQTEFIPVTIAFLATYSTW